MPLHFKNLHHINLLYLSIRNTKQVALLSVHFSTLSSIHSVPALNMKQNFFYIFWGSKNKTLAIKPQRTPPKEGLLLRTFKPPPI